MLYPCACCGIAACACCGLRRHLASRRPVLPDRPALADSFADRRCAGGRHGAGHGWHPTCRVHAWGMVKAQMRAFMDVNPADSLTKVYCPVWRFLGRTTLLSLWRKASPSTSNTWAKQVMRHLQARFFRMQAILFVSVRHLLPIISI